MRVCSKISTKIANFAVFPQLWAAAATTSDAMRFGGSANKVYRNSRRKARTVFSDQQLQVGFWFAVVTTLFSGKWYGKEKKEGGNYKGPRIFEIIAQIKIDKF